MRKHPLVVRTSPKGTPFIGTCKSCGKTGITFDALAEDACPDPVGMTYEQAILTAIEPETEQ